MIGYSALEALGSVGGMVMVKGLRHAVKMRRRRHEHKHVEDLVRVSPDVERTRRTSLRPATLFTVSGKANGNEGKWTYSVENSAKDVHGTVEDDPAQTHALFQAIEAVDEGSVDDGDDAGEPEGDEHHCAIGSPRRGAKALDPRNDAAPSPK